MKKTIIKSRLILLDKGHVLLLRQTKPNGGKYTFVGGRIERGEFAKQALIREIKEETNLEIDSKDLRLIHVLHKKDETGMRVIFYFRSEKWQGDPVNNEPHKFSSISWHRLDNLPKSISGTARHVLKMYRLGSTYSEFEKPGEQYDKE